MAIQNIQTIPEIDKERPNRWWFRDQIYDGPNNKGRFVPNVNDAVLDWNAGVFRVIAVDYGKTNMSLLHPISLGSLGGGVSVDDTSIVTGPGSNSTNFRIYVNTKVVPHTLDIDSRCFWNGTENHYVKIFRGTDISKETGVVISAVLNQSGTVVSENIPLETIVIPNGVNKGRKSAKPAHCSETVTDGELVTVQTYSASGRITSIDRFVIKTTNAMRTLDQSSNYVTGIELVSPFLSATDKRLVECPINMLTQSLQFTAKVTYDDGKTFTLPVDGTRFALAGKDFLVASQLGQVIDVSLLYTLSSGELALDSTAPLPNRIMHEPYRIKVIDANAYYTVKLFVVPEWRGAQYSLRFFVTNLERNILTDVTDKVEYGAGNPKFVGNKYDGTQSLVVGFDLSSLGASFSNFRHVQPFKITLYRPGNLPDSVQYYEVSYNNDLVFGTNCKAVYAAVPTNGNKQTLDITCGQGTVDGWLNAIYYATEPLRHEMLEPRAPKPTHVLVKVGTTFQREVPIEKILTPLADLPVATIGNGTSVRLEFISKQTSSVKQLGAASLIATNKP